MGKRGGGQKEDKEGSNFAHFLFLPLSPPFCNALREKREEEEELPFISGGEWRGEEAGEAEEKK